MTDADILRKARDLYAAAPSHVAYWDDPLPGTFCVYTALETAYAMQYEEGATDLFWGSYRVAGYIRDEIGWESVIDFNATHSTEEVLAVFDRAIERAEADNDR